MPYDNPEVDRHNAALFYLSEGEIQVFNDLMNGPMRSWPGNLADYARRKANTYGLCGDVLASAVAEWIRHQRVAGEVVWA